MIQKQSSTKGYVRLNRNLSLQSWIHDQLGFHDTKDLLSTFKNIDEGVDAEGRSNFLTALTVRASKLKALSVADLERYDSNIAMHLRRINSRKLRPITLRYFQYLALLYSEIYLDNYVNKSDYFLRSLNSFIAKRNSEQVYGHFWDSFNQHDLGKIALWMATGSGKTLMLHFHYYQYLSYNLDSIDNILLITPNEGLSQQHIEELNQSSIPCARFDLNRNDVFAKSKNTMYVIEITKLVIDKQGKGASVPIEAFEGNNLIFVDEGHKGSGGESWRSVRDILGKTGFTFEYSATFGQAVSQASDTQLISEYGKTIVFDYSYRYFYTDGYGKDFKILNLTNGEASHTTDLLLLANMLSFYEKKLLFSENKKSLSCYNLSSPLWVFVGGSVNAVYKQSGKSRSDILTVARFFHKVLSQPKWAKNAVDKLLKGHSGLIGDDNKDIVSNQFNYLKTRKLNSEGIYKGILETIFHTATSGGLELTDLRGSAGELGLRAYGGDYFGVIFIGDTTSFKQLVEFECSEIIQKDEVLSSSLFERINESDSKIEILAGSRKFIDGWNSWRVSNMGLLNIGRGEGSQIIQLFGRGVRLLGKDYSLKRSTANLNEERPDYIELLETLNIFGLRADYMAQFRSYVEEEGVDTHVVEVYVPIHLNEDFLNEGLVVPRISSTKDFTDQETIFLSHDCSIDPVSLSLFPQVSYYSSELENSIQLSDNSKYTSTIPPESLSLLDWQEIYCELLKYKQESSYSNVVILPHEIQNIIYNKNTVYTLHAPDSVTKPKSLGNIRRLQHAVTSLLCLYLRAFYKKSRLRWESSNMVYQNLDETDLNFQFNASVLGDVSSYIVKVSQKTPQLAMQIQQLIKLSDSLKEDTNDILPRMYYDRHLYYPILIRENVHVSSSPPGLVESEKKFIFDLKDYCNNTSNALPKGFELFLLRNLTRSKGVFFFTSSAFYPDFILWLKSSTLQRIVFIEPHGMMHSLSYEHDEKAQLHEGLPKLALEIAERSNQKNILLDSFIVSDTPFTELVKRYGDGNWTKESFAEKHILFQERIQGYDYIQKILQF